MSLDDATRNGYEHARILATGETAGVQRLLMTTALYVGIERWGWRTRYCYGSRAEAEAALAAWDGHGDPPGEWVKQKPEERLNPNLKE